MMLNIFPDPKSLAEAVTECFVQSSRESISTKGTFTAVLSGGSTPKAAYQYLAREAVSSQVDWPRVHLFFGDERCVPPDHPDSNFLMAAESLLDNIPIPPTNIHRMAGEEKPIDAARTYETTLKSIMGIHPRFDLVLLGMGTDGHTASLFPGTPALQNTPSWVRANYVPKLSSWRLTLTPAIINQAQKIVFLVSGSNKANTLHQVLKGEYLPYKFPSQSIQPINGELQYFADQAAASLI